MDFTSPYNVGIQNFGPFWVPHSISTLKAKANKRFVANVSEHAALGKFISFKVGLVQGPPWWHGKLNHGKFGFDSLTCLMGLDLVLEGMWLKASNANEELKVGSWVGGWGGGGGVSIWPKVTFHLALQNVFGADHQVVLGQRWVLSHTSL
jgi:hypothetical protein